MIETRPITDIVIQGRFRHQNGDLDSLKSSIRELGLLHPIVITPENLLIAGGRRLAACKELGFREVPVHVVPIQEVVRGELHENAIRKDFLPSEMVAIAKVIAPLERQQAKERMVAAHASPGKLPEQTKGDTRDRIARFVGCSGRTLERALQVVDAAEAEPQKFIHLVQEMDRTGRVNGVFRKLRIQQQAEAIEREPPPLPVGPFRVVVADPPWRYEKRASDPSFGGGVPYATMSINEIKGLPVADLAAHDAVLWLWTTNTHMRDAFDVLEAWGFTYKTTLTWVKPRMGIGDWLRGQTEHCMLAVRGRPVLRMTGQSTVLHAPTREHSRKPEEFYRMVEEVCPGSKVELFARQVRPGWFGHGHEIILGTNIT